MSRLVVKLLLGSLSTSVTFRAKLLPTVCRVPSLFYSGGGEVGGGGASRVKTAIYIQIQIQSQNAGGASRVKTAIYREGMIQSQNAGRYIRRL